MTREIPVQVQRGTAKQRVALALSLLKGETSAVEAARRHAFTVAEVAGGRDKFSLVAENALRSQLRNEEALKDEEITRLKQNVGELVPDLDIFRERYKLRPTEPLMLER